MTDPEKQCFLEVEVNLVDEEPPPPRSNSRPRATFLLLSLLLTGGLILLIFPTPSCEFLPSTFSKYDREILHRDRPNRWASHSINGRQTTTADDPPIPTPTARREVLVNFEVAQPVLMPNGLPADSDGTAPYQKTEDECTVLLMRRDFAWSYEDPFIGACVALLNLFIFECI